jgi:hypothetical protein
MIIRNASVSALTREAGLIHEISSLLAPSYENHRPLLERELAKNTHGYLGYSEAGALVAFFLVGWGAPVSEMIYLGLSASRETEKGTGAALRLYLRFLEDARQDEQARNCRFELWMTTAHPMVWAIINRIFAEVTPAMDGSFSSTDSIRARQLRSYMGVDQNTDNPFRLGLIASDTRYSEREAMRCADANARLQTDIFEKYDIREARGDRLLTMARVPSTPRKGLPVRNSPSAL